MRKKVLFATIVVSVAVLIAVGANPSGVPASVWSLKGNRGTHPPTDYLGTSDAQPLVLKTNGAVAITLGSDGTAEVHREAVFHEDARFEMDASVGGDLSVTGGAALETNASVGGNLSVAGKTTTGSLEAGSLTAALLQASSLEVTGTTTTRNLNVMENTTTASLNVAGTATTGVLEITGGDLAEPFRLSGARGIPAGAVVVIDDKNPGHLRLSNTTYDRRVAGVVSGAGGIGPGIVLYRQSVTEALAHVALAGRVYALANVSNGAIRPGDLLTTSAVEGHVMKVTDYQRAQGAVIGKAMSSLDSGQGLVLVLVNLQ